MKVLIFLLLFSLSFSYSQQILWEKEIPIEHSQTGYINDINIDSLGNLQVIFSQTSMDPQSEYLKVNSNGEVIFKNQIFRYDLQNKEKVIIPLSAKFNDNITSIFSGLTNESVFMSDNLVLPIIIQYDQSGNPIDTIQYYNSSDNTEFTNYGFMINTITKNNIYSNQKYFNVTIEDYEKYSENPNSYNHNILVICYDSLGKWVWGNSYEKINTTNEKYILKNVTRSKEGNLIILCHKYLMSGIDLAISQMKLLIVNEFGKKIISFDYQKNEKYYPKCVSEFEDGFIVLNQFSTNTYNSHFILTFSRTGEIINDFTIPSKYMRMTINKLVVTRNNGILLIGKYVLDFKDPTNPMDDIGKLFVIKYNSNLNKEWELESNDLLLSDNNYQDILISGNNEYVIVGYKNLKNRYISKIRDLTVGVQNSFLKSDISISPNPAMDYIEISVGAKRAVPEDIVIYDLLGVEVYCRIDTPPAPSPEGERIRIDVSHLSPGVYYVRVGDVVQKFVKML